MRRLPTYPVAPVTSSKAKREYLPKLAPLKNAERAGLLNYDPAICVKRGMAPGAVLLLSGRPMPKTKPARCEDCYFQQNMLCALNLGKPCTTFRAAERGLAPERQLAFVFRTERTTAAYAFPQPNS